MIRLTEKSELGKKYGGIFSIQLGSRFCVALTTPELVRSCLVSKGARFSNRPYPLPQAAEILYDEGRTALVWHNFGPEYRERKKMLASCLIGPNTDGIFEPLIAGEVLQFMKDVRSHGERTVPLGNLATLLRRSIMSVFGALICGRRFELNDPEFIKLADCQAVMASQNGPDNPADSLLFLRKLPAGWNPTRDFNKLKQTVKNFVTFAEGVINQQTSTYKSGQIRGFVDMMTSSNEKAGKLLFDKPTQVGLFLNLLNAGTTTTVDALLWLLLALCNNPEVQRKLQDEIDSVIGRSRAPRLSDVPKMPYWTLVLKETLRWRTIAPFSLPHATSEEVEVNGYTIPANTWIFTSLYSVHRDERAWPDGDNFRPERFADISPEDEKKYFIPWGLGPRKCLGLSIAPANLFLHTVSVLQHFTIAPVDGLIDDTPTFGLTFAPKPFSIKVTERSQSAHQ